MPDYKRDELLILAKTYPSPSTKYRETTCVAAVNRHGQLRRIFPVGYRFLASESQFDKWERIEARVTKAAGDNRPESYRIDADTITVLNEKIDTKNGWEARRPWFEPQIVADFDELESRRLLSGETLGVIRPSRLGKLELTPVKDADWTPKDIANLTQEGLFDTLETKGRHPLKKLGHEFHYVYECDTPLGTVTHRHMITDWEAGMLYLRCQARYGEGWEAPFRQKLEVEFAQRDLHLLMGTVHRFPDHWLIVGLIYPPKPEPTAQLSLL